MRSRIVVHVGYPKAASSFFQKELFNNHSDINNLGIYPRKNIGDLKRTDEGNCIFLQDKKLREFYNNLVMLNSLEYMEADNKKIFEDSIKKYLKKEKINLFSNERFSSVFFSHSNIVEKARRIKEIFGRIKVLFIIRNQIDLIKSQYADHPFDPRCLRFGKPVDINNWLDIAFSSREINFLNSLKYYEVIKLYIDLFGHKNIGVFMLEDLMNQREDFSEKISEFIGVKPEETLELLSRDRENKAVSKYYNFYRKLRRKMFSSTSFSKYLPSFITSMFNRLIRRGKREQLKISEENLLRLKKYYSNSNSLLKDKLDIAVNKYNYPYLKNNKRDEGC